MKLYEYEAKTILADKGIPTPRFGCAETPEQAFEIAASIGGPIVLKPQTLTKARGKAGLIHFAQTPPEAAELCSKILGQVYKREEITKVLVEERVDFLAELFVAVTVDYARGLPVLMVSASGGINVENAFFENPDSLLKLHISPSEGPTEAQIIKVTQFLCQRRKELEFGSTPSALRLLIQSLHDIFVEYDCELVEINPVAVREDGSLMALDAFMVVDDEAQHRHPDLVRPRGQSEQQFAMEQEFRKKGWSYIPMEGQIGILSSGAGITMAILDLIHLNGGRPANFLDTAQMDRRGIYEAFQIFHHSPGVKVLLVNIFAGLNRCDELALGIRDYLENFRPPFPIVVRMVGNKEKEGWEILREIGIKPIPSLEDAVREAVEKSRFEK